MARLFRAARLPTAAPDLAKDPDFQGRVRRFAERWSPPRGEDDRTRTAARIERLIEIAAIYGAMACNREAFDRPSATRARLLRGAQIARAAADAFDQVLATSARAGLPPQPGHATALRRAAKHMRSLADWLARCGHAAALAVGGYALHSGEHGSSSAARLRALRDYERTARSAARLARYLRWHARRARPAPAHRLAIYAPLAEALARRIRGMANAHRRGSAGRPANDALAWLAEAFGALRESQGARPVRRTDKDTLLDQLVALARAAGPPVTRAELITAIRAAARRRRAAVAHAARNPAAQG